MPRKSRLKLPPLNLGDESIGQRIARLRKERGYTQVELAEKMGLVQSLISTYELDQLRLSSEMVIRFALALEVTADELLGLKPKKKNGTKPSLKVLRRLNRIESLPSSHQKTLLKTIDAFLKGTAR